MNREQFYGYTIGELRSMLVELGGTPANKKKEILIDEIMKIYSGEFRPVRSNRGRPNTRIRREYPKTVISGPTAMMNDSEGSRVVDGILEVTRDAGALREINYQPPATEIRVPYRFIKEYGLIAGDRLTGEAAQLLEQRNIMQMHTITSVNGRAPEAILRKPFEEHAVQPVKTKINIDKEKYPDLAVVDLVCPLAKGQRIALLSKPNTGRTTLIANLARALYEKSEVMPIVVLIEERPEDISFVKSKSQEIECGFTVFDQSAKAHALMAETAFTRAKALVSEGKDVFLLIDSATKLVKAMKQRSNDLLTTEKAIMNVKQLLSMARDFGDASVTILVAIDETDDPEDILIAKEIMRIANGVIRLDENLASRRVYPAIDIAASYCKSQTEIQSKEDYEKYEAISAVLETSPELSKPIVEFLKQNISSKNWNEKLQSLVLSFKNN